MRLNQSAVCATENVFEKEATCLHAISGTQMRWSSLTHNRVLYQALARFLRESRVTIDDRRHMAIPTARSPKTDGDRPEDGPDNGG